MIFGSLVVAWVVFDGGQFHLHSVATQPHSSTQGVRAQACASGQDAATDVGAVSG